MSGFEREEYLSNDNEVLHQQHHDFEPFNDNKQSSVPVAKPKRKRESTLRKAPGAPKRFKSSYILFFMAQRDGIKKELGSKASVGEVSKRSSEKWRSLTPEEKRIWEDKAKADKERFNLEKERYTGPWQVPWKRAKKNPDAPKRPMSAFLYYSQEKRGLIKEKNPSLKNTEISRVLGQMWKNASEDERGPHIGREKIEREKYKIKMAAWREKEEERKAEIKIKNEEELRTHISRQNQPYHDERPEPIPYSVNPNSSNHNAHVSSDDHYQGYNHGAYHGYYPPHYGYDGYSQYPSSHYQRGGHHDRSDGSYGYYNDDFKPLPFKPDTEDIHTDNRYSYEQQSDAPPQYSMEPVSHSYNYDQHRQISGPVVSARSFDGDDDFGMQAPF